MTKILSEQVIKSRNKKNAICCACEMYGYGVEMLMLTFLFLMLTGSAYQFSASHILIFWQFEFGIKSTVQVMAGTDTRAIFLRIIRRADIFGIELIISNLVNRVFRKFCCIEKIQI